MAIQAAVCPQCGGNIQIDSDREKMFCQYCGVGFFVKDVINNHYEIHIHESVNNKIINSAKVRMDNDKEYNAAFDSLYKIIDEEQDNEEYWWLIIRAITCDFDVYPFLKDIEPFLGFVKKYMHLHKPARDEFGTKIYNYLCNMENYMSEYNRKATEEYRNYDNIWPALEKYKMLCQKNGAMEDAAFVDGLNTRYYDMHTPLHDVVVGKMKESDEARKSIGYIADNFLYEMDHSCWETQIRNKLAKLSEASKTKIINSKIDQYGYYSFDAEYELVYDQCVCSKENYKEVLNIFLKTYS